jgi:hypothetical protein
MKIQHVFKETYQTFTAMNLRHLCHYIRFDMTRRIHLFFTARASQTLFVPSCCIWTWMAIRHGQFGFAAITRTAST